MDRDKGIYHGPSRGTHGAHVIRYHDGRVTICTGFDRDSRAKAFGMLCDDEVARLTEIIGAHGLAEWLDADEVGPRQVPKGMRIPGFSYDEDYWITPIPEYAHLMDGYPHPTPSAQQPT
jgi:hypothetical protein